jgi:hypothetical protein
MTPFDDKKWYKQYEQLVEFKRKNGNCLVPKRHEQEDTCFGRWVSNQRHLHSINRLRVDREEILNEIGFVWRVDKDAPWHQQYEKLVEFKRNNGHCLVPQKYQEDASLGIWVSQQRQVNTNKEVRPDRKALLDKIGFAWKVDKCPPLHTDDPKWKKQYEKLVEFKRKNGNCRVPKRYQQDPFLGTWVNNHRYLYSRNTMRRDRKDLLDKIGFTLKAKTLLEARSSTTDVRGLIIGSFHSLFRICFSLLFLFCFELACVCVLGFGFGGVHRR